MPNWISGCRLKKYYTPLTQEQLKTLHDAKWRKRNNQLKAKMAREESKQRERGHILKTNKLKLQEDEELLDEIAPQLIISIQIGLE